MIRAWLITNLGPFWPWIKCRCVRPKPYAHEWACPRRRRKDTLFIYDSIRKN